MGSHNAQMFARQPQFTEYQAEQDKGDFNYG